MYNLFKMEGYRIKKSKSTYITLIGILLMIVLLLLVQYAFSQFDGAEIGYQTEDEGFVVEVYEEDDIFLSDNLLEEYFIFGYDQIVKIFVVIFALLFFTSPYKDGYIKNFIGMRKNRNSYILAQILAMVVFLLFVFILAGISMYIGLPLSFGDYKFTLVADMLLRVGVVFILFIGLISMLELLAQITRSFSSSLIIYFLLTLFEWPRLIDLGLDRIFNINNFTLSSYTIMGNLKTIQMTSTDNDLIRGLIVGILASLLGAFLSSYILNRRDV